MGVHEFSDAMCFSYGNAVYTREKKSYKGEVILKPHKLYLKDQQGEIAATFVPLEKVYKVTFFLGKMTVFVQPSNFLKFEAHIQGKISMIFSLVRDLAKQRGLRKRFFGLEWHDPDFFKVL